LQFQNFDFFERNILLIKKVPPPGFIAYNRALPD